MSIDRHPRRSATSDGLARFRPHGFHRPARPAHWRGRIGRQRLEISQGDLRRTVHAGSGESASSTLLELTTRSRYEVEIDRPINVIAAAARAACTSRTLGGGSPASPISSAPGRRCGPQPGEEAGADWASTRRWGRAGCRWETMRQIPYWRRCTSIARPRVRRRTELQISDFASYEWEWTANAPAPGICI